MFNPSLMESSAPLAKLIKDLNRWQRVLSCRELKSIVAKNPLCRMDLAEFVQFQDEDYCHQAIAVEPCFEIGCIGWRPGQASPIHDHRGSACCVQVVEGQLTNTDYMEHAGGGLSAFRTVQLTPENPLLRRDRQLHRVSNDDSLGRDAISLHIYSPPLLPIEQRSRKQALTIPSE